MMQVTDFFLRKRIFTFILMFLIVAIGIKSLMGLHVESTPEVNTPVIYAAIPLPGGAPEEVESLIMNPVEEKMAELEDVDRIMSTAWPNVSVTIVFFKNTGNPQEKFKAFREKIAEIKPALPAETLAPIVEEISFENLPMMFLGFSCGNKSAYDISKYAESIKKQLERLPGVKKIIMTGATARQVEIGMRPSELQKYGAAPLKNLIEKLNQVNTNMPGGNIFIGGTEYAVRTLGKFNSLEDLGNIVVANQNDVPVKLSQVADISENYPDPYTIVHVDGQKGVTLAIMKKKGYGTLQVAAEIKEAIKKYPDVVIMGDASDMINRLMGELKVHALWGVLLVMIVLFCSLGFRVAAIVGLALPLSFFMLFATMAFKGMSLDMVSLFAMLLALGMLVDNSIVVSENIFRHISLGKSPGAAALDATNEVGWPILSSTSAVVCAFLPLGLMLSGPIGDFTRPIPIVVTIALICSLVVANCFNPLMCSVWLKANPSGAGHKEPPPPGKPREAYRKIIEWSLGHTAVVMSVAGILLVSCFMLLGFKVIGLELFPKLDTAKFYIDVLNKPGTTIEDTLATVGKMEDFFKSKDYGKYVKHNIANVGSSGTRIEIDDSVEHGSNVSRVIVDLKPRNEIDRSHKQVIELFRLRLSELLSKDTRVTFMEKALGPPVGAPVNIQVSGDDYDRLETVTQKIRDTLTKEPGVVDLKDNLPAKVPQILLRTKQENLGKLGMTTRDFGGFIFLTLTGYKIGSMTLDGEKQDIFLKVKQNVSSDPYSFQSASFTMPNGQKVSFSDLVSYEMTKGYSAVEHEGGKRTVSITANVAKGFEAKRIVDKLKGGIEKMKSDLDAKDPEMAKLQVVFAGETALIKDAFRDLSRALLISLILIYLILLIEFRSTLQPLIILVCVPYALVGVIIGLLIMGYSFSILAGIGLLCLIGIVVNNGIIFIDYANSLQAKGKSRLEASIEACMTRLRPIILTKATVILGITPLAMTAASKTQFWKPMCWAIIWGLLIATTLTLVIIPVVYYITEGWRERYYAKRKRIDSGIR